MIKSLTSTTKTTNKLVATGAVVLATLLSACGTGSTDAQVGTAAQAPVAAEATAADTTATAAGTDQADAHEANTDAASEATASEAHEAGTGTSATGNATAAPAITTAPVDAASGGSTADTKSETGSDTAANPAPTAAATGPCPTYTVDNTFPVGLCAKGDLVTDIQKVLRFVMVATEVDGYYGPDTESTVHMLQGSFLLPQTGIVDEATYNAILEAGYDHDDEDVADEGTDWHDAAAWDEPGMNAGHDAEYYDNPDLAFYDYCSSVIDIAYNDPTNSIIDPTELEMCVTNFGH